MKFIWYPKCTTCQKAKKWLDERGLQYETRDIEEENPSYDELKLWLAISGLVIKKFFNTSGVLYRLLNLKERLPEMHEEECLRLLAIEGMLVKRPLLIGKGFVLVGFKDANWEKIAGNKESA